MTLAIGDPTRLRHSADGRMIAGDPAESVTLAGQMCSLQGGVARPTEPPSAAGERVILVSGGAHLVARRVSDRVGLEQSALQARLAWEDVPNGDWDYNDAYSDFYCADGGLAFADQGADSYGRHYYQISAAASGWVYLCLQFGYGGAEYYRWKIYRNDEVFREAQVSSGATWFALYLEAGDELRLLLESNVTEAGWWNDTLKTVGGNARVHCQATLNPGSPESVSATDGTHADKVVITWAAVSGADSYKVYRSATSSFLDAALIGSPSSNSYDDSTAAAGVKYWYWVKTVKSSLIFGLSDSDSGYIGAAAPAGVAASDGAYADKIRITWAAAAGATSYKVYRNTENNSATAEQIGAPESASFDDEDADAETTHWYWVKGVNALAESDFSSPDTGWYSDAAPAAPTGLAASDGAHTDKVALTWNAVNWAVSYKVYRNTVNDSGTAEQIAAPTDDNYDDTTAVPGTQYYYWIKAANAAGDSGFSAGEGGWRNLPPPENLRQVAAYPTAIVMAWDDVTGATSYELWASPTTTFGEGSSLADPATSPHTHNNPPAGTMYYWTCAQCALGNSAWAGPVEGNVEPI